MIQSTCLLYMTIVLIFFTYWMCIKKVIIILNKVIKGTKTRKDLISVEKETLINIKLSLIWPIALCRMLIKRIKS